MAEVTGMSADAINQLVNTLVASGEIDASGNFTLTTHDGTVINVGTVVESIPFASTTQTGAVKLATAADVTAGTDTTKAITPAELSGGLAAKQSSSANLTAIAGLSSLGNGRLIDIGGLSPIGNDILQFENGHWTNQTPSAVGITVDSGNVFIRGVLYNGTAYATNAISRQYVGTVDPATLGAVTNGSVWFDTSGS
jgi:hypothetical protein